jgi:hypothetical protein
MLYFQPNWPFLDVLPKMRDSIFGRTPENEAVHLKSIFPQLRTRCAAAESGRRAGVRAAGGRMLAGGLPAGGRARIRAKAKPVVVWRELLR